MTKRTKRTPKFEPTATAEVTSIVTDYENIFRSGVLAAAQAMSICAPAIRALTLVLTKEVPTMAVDKYYRVYVSPNFIDECIKLAREVSPQKPCVSCGETKHHDIAYVAGVICHEAWHPLREHQDRARTQVIVNGMRAYVYNVATDLEINDDLMQCFKHVKKPKLCLPPIQIAKDGEHKEGGVLIPSVYGFEEGKLAEEYFQRLMDKVKDNGQVCPSCEGTGQKDHKHNHGKQDGKQDGNQEACPDCEGTGQPSGSGGVPSSGQFGDIWNCGSGADGIERPYEKGPPGEDCKIPGLSAIESRMVRKSVAKKIQEAAQSRGVMPGGWARWADKELEPAKYDWRSEMNKAVRYSLSRVIGDRMRTFRRLGRRTASIGYKAILPSHYNPRPRIAIVQDTSGSMDEHAIKLSMSEAEAILRAAGAAVGFVACDAAADVVQEVHSIRAVKVHGGGGTDMRIGIKAALDSRPEPDIVVLMTDGYTPWPEQPLPKGKQLVVGLVGEHACSVNEVPSWARVIRITGDDVVVRPKV
jgi:predicted metal-dependent peptidase